MKVNFLIVGAQKGGTTALAKFLASHPDIYMAPRKEVYFFNNDEAFRGPVDWARYHRHFSGHTTESFIGEATPGYMYWPRVAARIHAYNPAMKLIFLLRNPVERAYSHYQMSCRNSGEQLSFRAAILAEPWRLWLARLQRSSVRERDQSYVVRGFYARQIARFLRYFPREQMLFLKSEDLREHHHQTLSQTLAFLGASPEAVPLPEIVHAGGYPHTAAPWERAYLGQKYASDMRRLEALLDWDLTSWRK